MEVLEVFATPPPPHFIDAKNCALPHRGCDPRQYNIGGPRLQHLSNLRHHLTYNLAYGARYSFAGASNVDTMSAKTSRKTSRKTSQLDWREGRRRAWELTRQGWKQQDIAAALRRRPQLTAFFTISLIFASSAAVNSFSAKATGHMAPSSRRALSLKPNVAYLVLNLRAGWKKQTTLPSLA